MDPVGSAVLVESDDAAELVVVSLGATDFEVVSLEAAGAGSEVVTDCSALVVDWLVDVVVVSDGVGSAAVVLLVVV